MAKPPFPPPSALPSLSPLRPDARLARSHGDASSPGERVALSRVPSHPAGMDGATYGTRAFPLALARGQAFHAYASRGTVFHVQLGQVAVSLAPRWLSGGVWREAIALSAGQVYVVETSGWLALSSDVGAQLALREGASPTRRLAESRGAIVRQWQRILERFGR